jgi:hypothetical protein
MALYAVSYQLNKQKNYQPLWDAFTELDAHKAMRDFYLIDNSASTEQIGDYLHQFIDEDDFLIVVPFVTRPYKHRCFEGTKAWLDARF